MKWVKGNILLSPADILTNLVNTVGVMGKGIALDFKRKFPGMYKTYQKLCKEKILQTGQVYYLEGQGKGIVLFPTKKHWREKSKLSYIADGLDDYLEKESRFPKHSTSIAFPELGCGNGGLNRDEVCPVMAEKLSASKLKVFIYSYSPDSSKVPPTKLSACPFNIEELEQAFQSRKDVLKAAIQAGFPIPGSRTFLESKEDIRQMLAYLHEQLVISAEEMKRLFPNMSTCFMNFLYLAGFATLVEVKESLKDDWCKGLQIYRPEHPTFPSAKTE